ncbi:DUF6500 family protein [Thorsellia anophelis]|uniref:DUF6500 family protein n=1 Tax=Thorsellia anophelis TaxID=336804 RepID=UPI000B804DAE|nr:DUF6500 family protein [Thorsellia anophelis]
MIQVCDQKIAAKGESVGLSFMLYFANKNDDPELLMQAATCWIQKMKFDHFENVIKIKTLIEILNNSID